MCVGNLGRVILFPRAMSQAAALARTFGECRESQIPRPLGQKEQTRACPVACCGIFDSWEARCRCSTACRECDFGYR